MYTQFCGFGEAVIAIYTSPKYYVVCIFLKQTEPLTVYSLIGHDLALLS